MNPVESLVKLAVLDLDDVRLTLLVPRLSKLHQQTRQSIPAGAIAVADKAKREANNRFVEISALMWPVQIRKKAVLSWL